MNWVWVFGTTEGHVMDHGGGRGMAVMGPSAASFHIIDEGTKLLRTWDCSKGWHRAGEELLRPRHVVCSLIAAAV